MTVLAPFVEGVSVTAQADVVAVAGAGAQVRAENVSPATLEEKVTRPAAGLDAVPAASMSVTVAVTTVGVRIVTGFGANVTAVDVARVRTVRGAAAEAAWLVVLPPYVAVSV